MNTWKLDRSIRILKENEPPEGYYLCFSGGKDSVSLYRLAQIAGVKFDAHYNYTTVDPPDLVKFIKREYPDVIFHHPPVTMWDLIVHKKMLPTKRIRYCCKILKEIGGAGRVKLTGIRAQESARRAKRKEVDNNESCCNIVKTRYVHPLFIWKTRDIWEFINEKNIPCSDLYEKGFKRIGCVGCPFASRKTREREFEMYPKIKLAYMHAIERMIAARKSLGLEIIFDSAEEQFEWWMSLNDSRRVSKRFAEKMNNDR